MTAMAGRSPTASASLGVATGSAKTTASTGQEHQPLTEWMEQEAEPYLPKPVAVSPSQLVPHDVADTFKEILRDDASETERQSLLKRGGKQYGTLVHALLEHLPELPKSLWQAAAHRVLEISALNLEAAERQAIISEAINVLEAKEFSELFMPNSSAETSFKAIMPFAGKKGEKIHMQGQIDRLVVNEHDVLVIDYKSDRHIPQNADNVSRGYIAQLAAYRLSVRPLFGDKSIKCALLWTKQPSLMWLPDTLLDEYEAQLPDLVKMSV